MASTRRKSAAIALAVVGIAGLSLASAATLNITSGTLQAGTEDLAGCQGGAAVDVSFDNVFDAGTGAYRTSGVNLAGIAALCAEQNIGITLIGADGAALGDELTGVLDGAPTFEADVDHAAEDIAGAAIIIHS